MPCDRRLKYLRQQRRSQTISERAAEVRAVADRVAAALASRRVKAKVGLQGAIAFTGLTEADRDGVSDACIYRQVMTHGSALARAAIEQAEYEAGRKVDQGALARGAHSHDGGATWHGHK